MFHNRVRRYLSAYADNELDSALRSKVAKHLERCAACQADLSVIRQAKKAMSSFASSVECSDNVWGRVSASAIQSQQHNTAPNQPRLAFLSKQTFSPRIAIPLTLSLVLVFILAIVLIKRQPVLEPPQKVTAAFMGGFDYHLFLDELMKSGSTPMFNSMYASERITGEKANAAAGFVPVVKPKLQQFHLQEINLLTNTCCHALQLTYMSDQGKVFVFQQPEDHPLRFDHKEAHEMQVDGFKCLLMQKGTYRLALLKTEKKAFVVVGDVDSTALKDVLRSLASNTF